MGRLPAVIFWGRLLQPLIRGRTIIRWSQGRGLGRRSSGKDRFSEIGQGKAPYQAILDGGTSKMLYAIFFGVRSPDPKAAEVMGKSA
jgi:hypothetical protein